MDTTIFATRSGQAEVELFEPAPTELPELLLNPDVHIWVNLNQNDPKSQDILSEIFKIHPLLIEDACADATTPKSEIQDDYLYFIIHGLSDAHPKDDGEIKTADLDFFLGERWLITHYRHPFDALKSAVRAVKTDPILLHQGPAHVAHRVLDIIVDEFLPVMARLDEEIDALEERVVRKPGPETLERIFSLRHSLQRMRRVGLHQQRLLTRLANQPINLIPEDLRPFFADVSDHFTRVTDLNEEYRELLNSMMETYLGMQSHRLNEIMRLLTFFSTFMLPLTFITGLYGMNFDYMPGLHWRFGYETSLAAMMAFIGSMWVYFRWRGWL